MINRFVRSPEGQELAALCLDYGYKLAERPSELTRDQILFLMAALSYRVEQQTQARMAAQGITRIKVVEDEEGE